MQWSLGSGEAPALTMRIVSEDLDPERLDEITTHLLLELRELPMAAPEHVYVPLPAGARGAGARSGALGWDRIPEALTSLVDFLRDWLRRSTGSERLELRAGPTGPRLELSSSDEEVESRILEWLRALGDSDDF